MKYLVFHIFPLVAAFCVGILAVLGFSYCQKNAVQPVFEIAVAQPDSIVEISETSSENYDYKVALENIWIDNDETHVDGYTVKRKCNTRPDEINTCILTIKHHGKVVAKFENGSGEKDWLRYGFFNFLGTSKKQLVVHLYSGGAHCCYDYFVYDLSPRFRPVYESLKFDNANEVGNQLVPVDIDGDGVYEFYQDVMAFDYQGAGGHASASFPPAIFSFNEKTRLYTLANKRFPGFVMTMLSKNLSYLDKEIAKNNDYGMSAEDRAEDNQEYRVRETFLFWIYAGEREKAWKYFRENYRSKISGKYMDEFREQFIEEFAQTLKKDPTYLSIYGR